MVCLVKRLLPAHIGAWDVSILGIESVPLIIPEQVVGGNMIRQAKLG